MLRADIFHGLGVTVVDDQTIYYIIGGLCFVGIVTLVLIGLGRK